ncbi:tetratricopeptide repeat protein [Embleya scabrispora]|uniref:tetratricopeptide repeat protein n=1 Tax=Embleya scabrispora TaxID=159449 RepID=UPI00036A8180|nr:tetratricopeptide repeat protein [Embleya scabrispora]MYS84985.1 tetratricopeptide repeat protein [Streptomyces sp. SID5474]
MSEHPLSARAHALMELDRHEEAGELLARRVAEDPSDTRAWVRLAYVHLKLGHDEEVVAASDAALAVAPEDYEALLVRVYGLRKLSRGEEAEAAARAAIGVAPDLWQAHAALSEALNSWQPRWPEAFEAACTAVRLGPEAVGAHWALWKASLLVGRNDVRTRAVREVLRIDPQNAWALGELADHAKHAAARPALIGAGAKLPAAADAAADALAADPTSERLRADVDTAVFRMLRGTRWIALLCLVIAALAGRVFPTGDDPTALPAPLGIRLWALTLMGIAWVLGAWRRYRRLRTGVKLSMWSLIRRVGWARLVLIQTAWCTLTAVLIVTIPWTGRLVPQILFWVSLVPTLLTVRLERAASR